MAGDNDLINLFAAAIVARILPAIPINYHMWEIGTIAQCLKLSKAQARERLAP